MKKKRYHKFIAALWILLPVLAFTGCEYSYRVNGFGTNALKKEDAKEFNLEKTKVAPITKIKVNTEVADIELVSSDDYYVEISYSYWNQKPRYSLENGILEFDDSKAFPDSYSIDYDFQNLVTIYLPKDANLKEIALETSSGDIEAAGFLTEKLDAVVSYGDLTIKDANAGKADISLSSGSSDISSFNVGNLDYSNSYGDASFTDINTKKPMENGITPELFYISMSSGDCDIESLNCKSVSISNSYGDVTSEGITAEDYKNDLSSGNLIVTKSKLNHVDVSNSYGDASLSLTGKEEEYSLDLNTSYGSITVGGEKYDGRYTRESSGSKNISANLSSGDIEIQFINH